MNTKRVLLMIIFLLALASLFAQEEKKPVSTALNPVLDWCLGVEGGFAYNFLYTNVGYRTFTSYDPGIGFSVGIPVRFKIFDWFALQITPEYIQKNYIWKRTSVANNSFSEYTNSFISFPLAAQFSLRLLNGLEVYALAGGYIGLWVLSQRRGKSREWTEDVYNQSESSYYHFNEIVPFDNRRDNRFDAGILAGIGFQYELGGVILFAEGSFKYGLTDLQHQYMEVLIPRMNDTWELRVGVLINISTLALNSTLNGWWKRAGMLFNVSSFAGGTNE